MKWTIIFILVFMCAMTSGQSQQTEPIYLQYDGWLKNSDGGYTLSFGYFNYNRVEVPIEPGADNKFTPGDPDRNQPARFQPGRHRNSCVMIVDARFDGKVQWTLSYGGTASTTTSKILDPLYELDEGMVRRATQGIDANKAPRGVCLNHAPWLALATWVPNQWATNRTANE
jgi:hypothetical protein